MMFFMLLKGKVFFQRSKKDGRNLISKLISRLSRDSSIHCSESRYSE